MPGCHICTMAPQRGSRRHSSSGRPLDRTKTSGFPGLGQFGGQLLLDFGKRDRRARGVLAAPLLFLPEAEDHHVGSRGRGDSLTESGAVLAVEVAAPGVEQFGAAPVFVFQPGEEAHRVLFAAVCRPRAEQVQPVLRHRADDRDAAGGFQRQRVVLVFQQHHRLLGEPLGDGEARGKQEPVRLLRLRGVGAFEQPEPEFQPQNAPHGLVEFLLRNLAFADRAARWAS